MLTSTEGTLTLGSSGGRQVEEPTEPGAGGADDGEQPSDTDDETEPDTDTGSSTPDDDPIALLERADEVFLEADEALADGDLGAYQEKIDEARQLIADAFAILEQP